MPFGSLRVLRLSRLFAGTPTRRRRTSSVPIAAEVLETRQMLSAVTIGLERGTLEIRGTSGNDAVSVVIDGDAVRVEVADGGTHSFERADVSKLRFRGFAGNDVFVNATDLPSYAWGGAGDDSLTGGTDRDRFFGGAGNDLLVGGSGRDLLVGGAGSDEEFEGDRDVGVKSAPTTVGAVTSDLRNGILVVRGTNNADRIQLTLSGVTLTVRGGTVRSFDIRRVNQIVVEAGSGNDTVDVAANITRSTLLYGGYGNDTINGGGGADQIYGGHGVDRLDGRGGNDFMTGGAGYDAVIGGTGTNRLYQGSYSRVRAMSSIEVDILRRVNAERARRGLRPLVADSRLAYAAHQHSYDMAHLSRTLGNSKAHSHALWGVTMPTPPSRIDFAGFEHSMYAENIAYGYRTGAAVVAAWMASAGHRANILSPTLTHLGVGVRANAAGVLFYTQSFARAA